MSRHAELTMQFVCMDDAGRTEDWRTGDTTKMVAVLAALGIPIGTDKVWRDKQGDERVTYVHGPRSIHEHRSALPETKTLAKLYRTGELQRTDPLHPMLDGLRAIHNLLALRTWLGTGQEHELKCCAAQRALLMPGTAPRPESAVIVRTANIHRAAALCLLGCSLLRIDEPSAGQPAFAFLNTSAFTCTAAQLITEHKAGKLDHTHPFAFAVECTRTYLRLLKHVDDELTVLLFKSKHDGRYAFVREDASDRTKLNTDRFIAGDD